MLITAIVIFFAMNMGASGIAPSFAAIYGGNLFKKKTLLFLFGLFVVLGAVALGRNVSITLGKGLIPTGFFGFEAALIILSAAAISLSLANILKIPQSTSQVTVGAIVGAGLYFRHLNVATLIFKILPMWVILPFSSYILTLAIYGKIYPPQSDNLHIYEKLFANENRLKISALIVGCYVAFAIGTNNVANAVGPLSASGILGMNLGLFLISPIFGIGALALGKGPLETAGKEIIPLGLFSSTLVSFVTASLLIVASSLGVPQSLVQLNLASIFAISCLKEGHKATWDREVIHKTFAVWLITPVFSAVISYVLFLIGEKLLFY